MISRLLCSIALSASLIGCSGGEFKVVKVTGDCQCDGQPIKSGWLQFAPIPESNEKMPGKASIGQIQPDGTFTLTTYAENDGAVVGKHRVTVNEPSMPEAAEIKRGAAVPEKHNCQLAEELRLEVKPGEENHFVIQMIPRSPKPKSRRPEYVD